MSVEAVEERQQEEMNERHEILSDAYKEFSQDFEDLYNEASLSVESGEVVDWLKDALLELRELAPKMAEFIVDAAIAQCYNEQVEDELRFQLFALFDVLRAMEHVLYARQIGDGDRYEEALEGLKEALDEGWFCL